MITVIGLGPGDLDRVPGPMRDLLSAPDTQVVSRTRDHPAAAQLAAMRPVVFCDDLYESLESFESVYDAICNRVLEASEQGPVVYAVPGSARIGEFAVRRLLTSGREVEVLPGESFVDAVLEQVGYDPLDRGLQILNAHDLPDPLILDKPTIVAHVDSPIVLSEVAAQIDRVTGDDTRIVLMAGAGSADSVAVESEPDAVDASLAGVRTSLFVDPQPGGVVGAIQTMRLLREECPWDREQTHATLIKNLVEESYELIEAIGRLDEEGSDWVGYAEVEDELGDVLLQVLFHAVIARQAGAFDIDDVAEVMRQKLVRRHPHVFGDVQVESAGQVKENWDRIKAQERAGSPSRSAMDGVPENMPALYRASKLQNRAAKIGFDWSQPSQVLLKVNEELGELASAMDGDGDVQAELGDVMFSIVNLSRHLGLDAETALRSATRRFEQRFRSMESEGPLEDLDLESLNRRWGRAKEGRVGP